MGDEQQPPSHGAGPPEDLRERLCEAMVKWHECMSLLGSIRREACYHLNPRRSAGGHGRAALNRRRSKASVIPMGWYQGKANLARIREWKDVFVKVDRLVNRPASEWPDCREYGLAPSLFFVSASQCGMCGLPLPPGQKTCRSSLCRGGAGKPELVQDAGGGKGAASPDRGREPAGVEIHDHPNPESGMGERNLECGYYDACLNLAVFCEWESFHCQRCEMQTGSSRPPDPDPETGNDWQGGPLGRRSPHW